MKKTINPVRLVQGIFMLLAGIALLWLSATRCYQYYVTPRSMPYLIFAAVMFLAIGGYNFSKLHELTHVRRYAHLLALVLPLLMLGASTKAQDLWQTPLFPAVETNMYNDPSYLSESYTMKTAVYEGKVIHGYDPAHQTITIMEAETYFWLIEIYADPTPFLGYTIHTMGQVMTDTQYLSSDCFSPVRKLMTCCVADMYSIGFPVEYDEQSILNDGDWVSVTGTLALVDLDEENQELRILADAVEPCAPPDEPYVYSY